MANGMSAESLQRAIVTGIEEFLDRAHLRVETLPEKLPFKMAQGYVVLNWLRARLDDEIGPTARFRLLPSRKRAGEGSGQ